MTFYRTPFNLGTGREGVRFQRLTQRSVKFIRWLRQNLWSQRPLPDLWAILKLLYRTS